MSCWGVGSLSRIASVIGTPVFADECTTKQTRVSYARMLIEVNVTKELPTEIVVMDPYGKKFLQAVTYDWKPSYCDKCLVVGHKCTTQAQPIMQQSNQTMRTRGNKVITQEWRTKRPIHVATGPQNAKQTPSDEQQLEGNKVKVIDQRGTTKLPDPKGTNAQHNIIPGAAREKPDDRGKAVQSPELNFINFRALTPIPVKNRFEAVSTSRHEEHIPPADRGGNTMQL